MADVGTLAAELRTAAVRLLERAREQNRQMQCSGPKDVELERVMERTLEHLDAHRFNLRALLDDSNQVLKLIVSPGLEPGLRQEADQVNGVFHDFLRVFIPEAIRQEIRDAGGISAYLKKLRSEALDLTSQADAYYRSQGWSPDENSLWGILRSITDHLDEEDPTAIDTKTLRDENLALFLVGSHEGVFGGVEKEGTFGKQLGDFSFRLGEVLKVLEEDYAVRR